MKLFVPLGCALFAVTGCIEPPRALRSRAAPAPADAAFEPATCPADTRPTSGSCHAPLVESSCPGSWDRAGTVACPLGPGEGEYAFSGPFLDYLIYARAGGLGGHACIYDRATLRLIADYSRTDSPAYCCRSYDIWRGRALPELPLFAALCAAARDAGVAD